MHHRTRTRGPEDDMPSIYYILTTIADDSLADLPRKKPDKSSYCIIVSDQSAHCLPFLILSSLIHIPRCLSSKPKKNKAKIPAVCPELAGDEDE